jgi:hypothetical protein
VVSSAGAFRTMPALFTSTSTGPRASRAVLAMVTSSDPTSPLAATASAPAALPGFHRLGQIVHRYRVPGGGEDLGGQPADAATGSGDKATRRSTQCSLQRPIGRVPAIGQPRLSSTRFRRLVGERA